MTHPFQQHLIDHAQAVIENRGPIGFPYPTPPASRTGWGKLVETSPGDAADGKWLLTEYIYDAAAADWEEAAHPPGYEAYEFAYEIHGSTANSAGDLVQYWEGILKDGTPCLFFDNGAGSHEYPYEVLPATIDGDGETAQEDTWDVAAPPAEKDGVLVKLTTRVVYNAAGDTILYGFHRAFEFDSAGKLVTISAETRYTVDTPDACP